MVQSRRDKKEARKGSLKGFIDRAQSGGDVTCLKLPENVEIYKLEKTGQIELDFLSFKAGEGNTDGDPGYEVYHREYKRHELNTPQGFRTIACRKAVFGKKCACCDWLTKYGGTAEKEMVNKMRPKDRHLWLVVDEPGSKNPAYKVFDSSHKNRGLGFAEVMSEALQVQLGDDYERAFSHGKDGKTAVLRVKKQSFPGGKYNCVTRIDFRDRKYGYEDSFADVPCLDDMLVDPGYEEIKELLPMPDGDDEDEDDRKAKSRRDDDDDDADSDDADSDDADEDEDEPSTAKKSATKAKRSEPDDDDDEEDSNDTEDSEDLDEDSEDDDDTPSAKKSSRGKSKKSSDDDENELEDSDDSDEEDDEPRKRGTTKTSSARRGKPDPDEDDDDTEDDIDNDDESDEDLEEEEPRKRKSKKR